MIKDLEIFEHEVHAELMELAYDGDDYLSFED